MSRSLMMIAGEASGDLHGSALVKNLKRLHPDLRIIGIGGDKMKSAGMETIFHIKDMAFLGFAEIIKHLPYIKKVRKKLLSTLSEEQIETLVLIDYPGFNLNLAKKAKRLGVKIVYYISPQIWAWGVHRVKKMKRLIDKMIVVFPFEKDFYEKENVPVEFVGHPLMERIIDYPYSKRSELLKQIGMDENDEYLLLMPGSRMHEIELMYKEMIEAAIKLQEKFNLKIVVAVSDNISESEFHKSGYPAKVKIVKEKIYDLMRHAKFGIIKSGTSTLEAAIVGMPFIVTYKTGSITYAIGKALVRIDNIAMPNIVAGKTIVEELIQKDVKADMIFERVSEYLENNDKLKKLVTELTVIKEKLSTTDNSPSLKTAEIISSFVYETR